MATKKSKKDASGNYTPATPEERENALVAFGKSLLARFRFELPSEVSDEETDELGDLANELGNDVSITKMLLDDAMELSKDNLSTFITYCENASKSLKKSARIGLARAEEYFLAWASGFAPKSNIKLANGKGSSLELDKGEFERSTRAYFYNLGKVSNSVLFGKKASAGKDEVKSMFHTPGRAAKLEGFKSGDGGTHRAEASVSHYILDNEGNVEGALTQFGLLAKHLNNRDPKKLAETYRTLAGIEGVDTRYSFEDWAIEVIGQARFDGMIAAQFDEQANKAAQALRKREQYLALNAKDRERVKEIKRLLLNAKEDSKKSAPETIGGSTIPAPETKATDASDPNLTLNRWRSELAEEMEKPESSDDESIPLRNGRKVKLLEAQIATLSATLETIADVESESSDSAESDSAEELSN